MGIIELDRRKFRSRPEGEPTARAMQAELQRMEVEDAAGGGFVTLKSLHHTSGLDNCSVVWTACFA